MHKFIATLLLIAFANLSFAVSTTESIKVRYEPHLVTLTGVLELVIFPGPPNYQSVAEGDEPESTLVLRLDFPMDVQGNTLLPGEDREGMLNISSHTNITIVHVVCPPDTPAGYWSRKTPARVIVHGTLMEGHTAHHHTKVVLFSKSIEVLAPTN